MKIAVAVLSDGIGGTTTYMMRLVHGLRKIEQEVDIVFLVKGDGRGLKRLMHAAGASVSEQFKIASNSADGIDLLNMYDWVIWSRPGGISEPQYAKIHSEKDPQRRPWYYDVINSEKVKALYACILHERKTYGKFSPYINDWEYAVEFFLTNKLSLAKAYEDDRGYAPSFSLGIPIDTTGWEQFRNNDRVNIIANTSRIVPDKRQLHLVMAMGDLPNWDAEFHSRTRWYHYHAKMVDYVNRHGLENVWIATPAKSDKFLSNELLLDEIYGASAVVFNSYRLPGGQEGGCENATMEGAIRGAVPLLDSQWVGHDDSPPEEACYVWHPIDEKGKSDIAEVVRGIDQRSPEYMQKQETMLDFLLKTKDDQVIAKHLVSFLNRWEAES